MGLSYIFKGIWITWVLYLPKFIYCTIKVCTSMSLYVIFVSEKLNEKKCPQLTSYSMGKDKVLSVRSDTR